MRYVRIAIHLTITYLIIWKGEVKTSMHETERNAVTWGVFPGQEIIQPTIIEEESFLTWKVRVPDCLSKV
jgi:hypothetical protein